MYSMNEVGSGVTMGGAAYGGAGIQPTVQLATAPMGGYGSGYGGFGGEGIWPLLLLALWGRGGFGGGDCGGFGGGSGGAAVILNDNVNSKFDALANQYSAGQAAIIANNNSQSLVDAVRDVDGKVCDTQMAIANNGAAMQQGFGNVALTTCQQTGAITNAINGIGTNMLLGFQNTNSQLASCCCETQKAIMQSAFQGERDKCDIVNAIHADGEATRSLMTQNTIQDLRDRLTAANLTNSQCAQNATLINALRPTPVPSYPVFGNAPIFQPVVSAESFCGFGGSSFGRGGCGGCL